MRMQNGGGLAALEEMQGMNPVASGLGAMAGVMEGSDPDSSMMQIQEMMMEGPSPDGDMQDIVVQEAISAIRGEHANPEIALQAFVTQFGQDALGVLAQQVNQEMMLEQMGQNKDMLVEGDGMIEGIGKGRDDMVQATLEGEQDVLLSRGEFVVPSDVVSGIGDGSSQAGEDEVKAGQQHLFIVYDEDKEETKAAWTSKFIDYPSSRALQTLFIGGSGYDEWIEEVNEFIKSWAEDNGCNFVEFTGRKGWERKLKGIGWTSEYCSYRMEV